MNVYLIADIEVHEPAIYADYVRRARPLVLACGGRYRVRDGEPRPLSGGWSPARILVIEFPSMDAMRSCFESEAYKAIAPLRERSTTSRAVVARGLAEGENE